MAAGWQLQIDSQGIRRTRLWLWEDVWSWDEFRSGRVRPSISETNTFRDDQRPLFRRSVSFDWLPFEDVIRLTKACHALCEAAGAVPVIVTPVRMKVITLPMFLELEASPDGLRIRRLGVWSSVAWDEVQEIRIWRPTREWIGRLREV